MSEIFYVVPEEQHNLLVAAAYKKRGYSKAEAEAGARFCADATRHGIRTHNDQQVPTYDIYIKGEDGMLKRLTDNNRVFYTTREELGKEAEAAKAKAMEGDIEKALRARANERAIELRSRANADALKNRPLMEKFGDKN